MYVWVHRSAKTTQRKQTREKTPSHFLAIETNSRQKMSAQAPTTHRPQSSSFLGLPYRILHINPFKKKTELLRGLWVCNTLQAKPNGTENLGKASGDLVAVCVSMHVCTHVCTGIHIYTFCYIYIYICICYDLYTYIY